MRLKRNKMIQYEAVAHYLRMLFIMVYLVNPDDWRKSYFCDHDGETWFADNYIIEHGRDHDITKTI